MPTEACSIRDRVADRAAALSTLTLMSDPLCILTVHAHPTWPESMMEAAEAVHKQAIHILNT